MYLHELLYKITPISHPICYRFHQSLYTILGKNSYAGLQKPVFVFPRVICESAHNSRKKQLSTYLAYESRPLGFPVL